MGSDIYKNTYTHVTAPELYSYQKISPCKIVNTTSVSRLNVTESSDEHSKHNSIMYEKYEKFTSKRQIIYCRIQFLCKAILLKQIQLTPTNSN